MPVSALSTVELPVADLARACAWYARQLGLRETWRGETQAMLSVDGTQAPAVFLVQSDDPGRLGFTAAGRRNSVVDFEVQDLDAFHARLADAGADVDELAPGAFGFGFRDVDGNALGAHRPVASR